jgi:co-chaperonin GroES (HSP10)
MLMVHDADPRQEIWNEVETYLDKIDPLGAELLVAVYKRPERTKGGLILSDVSRREDEFQGKVGLVLKMGPVAFTEDGTHRWGDQAPAVGDWVLFKVGDTFSLELGERRCRFVEDVNVRAILMQPDVVL